MIMTTRSHFARLSGAGGRRRVRRAVAPWTRPLVAGLVVALAPALAAAQEDTDLQRTAVTVLVDRYRKELETPSLHMRSETRGLLIAMLTGNEVQVQPDRLNALIVALDALARSDADSDVRADAASLLAIAAEADLPTPRPELTTSLLRLYTEVDDELVRRTLMASMPRLADRGRALAFLRGIAEQAEDSYPEEAWDAVRRLVSAGPDGRQTIRAIHAARSARNPSIQRVVDELVASEFRTRPPH